MSQGGIVNFQCGSCSRKEKLTARFMVGAHSVRPRETPSFDGGRTMCAPTARNRSFLAMKAVWMEGPRRGEGAPPHGKRTAGSPCLWFHQTRGLSPAFWLPQRGSRKGKGWADGDIGPYKEFAKAGGFLRTYDAAPSSPARRPALQRTNYRPPSNERQRRKREPVSL